MQTKTKVAVLMIALAILVASQVSAQGHLGAPVRLYNPYLGPNSTIVTLGGTKFKRPIAYRPLVAI